MSMYDIIERNGETIVVDHFTGQPVSAEERNQVIAACKRKEAPATKAEETESPEKQDQKA
jgi:hypothetical protein